MKNFNLYLLFFIISLVSKAQKLDLRFNTIEYDENFPQSTILEIEQSKKGFIWLGTDNGLLRYDGYNFTRYYTKNREFGTISDNNINTIYEDTHENLWVGTNHGVNLYNINTNNFTIVDILPSKGGRNYISSFVEDNQNNLWVGTFGGVRKIDKENLLLLDVFKNSKSLAGKSKVFSLFYDKEFGVLVGTDFGLQNFDPKTGKKLELPTVIKNNTAFHQNKILKITKDTDGDLWFATEKLGVFLYSKSKNQLVNYKYQENNKNSISSNNIKDILPVDKNTIWFATDNGLSVLKKNTQVFIRYQHNPIMPFSISDNNITSLLKDRESSVWLGTKVGSINFFNESNTNFVNINESINNSFGLNNSIVNALANDKEKTLWVGTNGGGLNFLDFKTHTRQTYLMESFSGSKVIKVLKNKNEDIILCGTLTGLYEFNKKTKSFKNLEISNKEIQVSSIIIDGNTTWIGTDGDGLIQLSEKGSIKNYKKIISQNSISDNFIIDIENSDDGLWISTQFGLDFYNKETGEFTNYFKGDEKNSLSNNSLTTLFIDSKDRLWVGLGYGGLNYFDKKTKKFYLLNESLGFTDGAIKSIKEDKDGALWLSTNNSLFKIKIKEFNIPFKKSNFEITSYGAKNGITIKNYSINCATNLENKLVFGGGKGLILFNPSTILKPRTKSEIVLTKLTVNNEEVKFDAYNTILQKDISEASAITLNHNQRFIGIQFSSLNFIHTEKNEYAYKLESTFDDGDWQNIGAQNNINLAGLKSGSYTFKLKSLTEINNSNTIKSLSIKILPPWWHTNLAYFLYTLLILSVLIIIMNFIKSKIFIKQQLLSRQTESDRQKELHNMKLDFFTNISHEIRTPLTLINGPVEELLETSKEDFKTQKKLLTIKKNSDRLLKLINELLDFRKIESKQAKLYCEERDIVQFCYDIYESFKGLSIKKNIDYKFVMNSKAIPLYFDENQMEKVIYNLLSNAFKFTKKNGKIVISIEEVAEDNNWVEIKIKDNGIGISEESKNSVFKSFFQLNERGHKNIGSGIGLALSKTIVELHSGKLSIEEEPETWTNTVFKIALKKGKAHLNIVNSFEKITPKIDTLHVDEKIEKFKIEDSGNLIVEEVFDVENDQEDKNKKTLFIIDDQKDIRKFLVDILQDQYPITAFSNAQSSLDYMEKEIPDLIICDVMMPEMDGFEFCKRIKTSEATNHIPVILLTAKASTQSRIEGLTIGADAYISKPFSIKVLKLNIINLLSTKEILREKYSGRFIVDSELEKLEVPEELFIKKLMNIIESKIDKPDFDVNELVDDIGMSRTVLYKKVKSLTNHSVASLIKHLRLKKAADILKNKSYPISEVTYLVGFNDRKHFSKEFKKVYRMSPTDYRNSKVENS